MEKAREFQKNIYCCFINYAKAFDRVDHNKLWKILKDMGIPDHLTCLFRNLYAAQEATVRTGHGTTNPGWQHIYLQHGLSPVQSLSHVWLFVTPWTAAHQASLSITNSQSLPKLMSIEWIGDAIQPSHPLSSPSHPAFNLSQHQGLFQWVCSLN